MNEVARIAGAIEKHPPLKAGAEAALELFNAAVSGRAMPQAKYESWAELDSAFEDVKLETLKSSVLRRLFRLAISCAASAYAQRR